MYRSLKHGFIELIVGGMFAGKTSELIRRISVLERAKKKVLIFKPNFDKRDKEFGQLTTHDGQKKHNIFFVKKTEQVKNILENDNSNSKILAFDEIQFFSPCFVDFIEELANSGYRIICAGLDRGFNDQMFPTVMRLLSYAEFVTKLHAVCIKCGEIATKTQRIDKNGNPISPSKVTNVIGGCEAYQARCRECFVYFSE